MMFVSMMPEEQRKLLEKAIVDNDRLLLDEQLKKLNKTVTTYRNSFSGTLLHEAAELGSPEMVKYLLQAGCKVNATDDGGGTALTRASENKNAETRLEIVKILIQAGSSVKSRADKSPTLHHFVENGHLECAKLLIEKGADVNSKQDRHGFTLLHIAASRKNYETIMFLLDHGADPRINSKANRSTLQFALQSRGSPINYDFIPDIAVLRKLLQHGADPNAQLNRGGTTVFHKILQHADYDTVRLFINHGARFGSVLKGKTVRTQAGKNKDGRVLRLITALQTGDLSAVDKQ